jgi:crotonobetainyl-CoA:carnitine CoA-transferase CaiB-like acyl-CoA transferase
VTSLPLARCTVLDLTIARAGPVAVRLLADWGANVIRIDHPDRKEASFSSARRGADEQNLHRNKRSLALDLKHPEGRELFLEMAERADVVVENFRPGVMRRLGLDYETLAARNPRIVLASLSGFGQDGPYASRPGVDQIIQGMSGMMSITGEPGRGPMRAGVAISDTSAGMFLGQGILLALLERERSGRGQWVHTSLLEAMLSKLDFQAARYTMSGEVPGQEGNDHPTAVPMGLFESADGLVNVAASSAKAFAAFCSALGATELGKRPEYATLASRLANRQALHEDVNRVTRRFATEDLIVRLNAVGVPCGRVNDMRQAFDDPQVRHLRMTATARHDTLGELQLPRTPIHLSEHAQQAQFERAAPDPGQHSDEILREFGCDAERIARLRREGVVQ